jgi:hypothetical protein
VPLSAHYTLFVLYQANFSPFRFVQGGLSKLLW